MQLEANGPIALKGKVFLPQGGRLPRLPACQGSESGESCTAVRHTECQLSRLNLSWQITRTAAHSLPTLPPPNRGENQ